MMVLAVWLGAGVTAAGGIVTGAWVPVVELWGVAWGCWVVVGATCSEPCWLAWSDTWGGLGAKNMLHRKNTKNEMPIAMNRRACSI